MTMEINEIVRDTAVIVSKFNELKYNYKEKDLLLMLKLDDKERQDIYDMLKEHVGKFGRIDVAAHIETKKSIFADAEFGDKFKCKNGKIAIYLGNNMDSDSEYPIHMIYDNAYGQTVCTLDGIPYMDDESRHICYNADKVIDDKTIVGKLESLEQLCG